MEFIIKRRNDHRMNKLFIFFNEYEFAAKERYYVYLGLAMLGFSACIAFVSYVAWPVFTGEKWVVASPFLHWLVTIGGGVFFWLGSGTAIKQKAKIIDKTYNQYYIYKVIRFLGSKTLGLILVIIFFFYYLFLDDDGPSSQSGNNYGNLPDKTADDIWDGSPKHYYDEDPPEPFS